MKLDKWLEDKEKVSNEYSENMSILKEMYIRAFHEYFKIPHAKDEDSFFVLAKENVACKSDLLFLNWLREEGFSQLSKISDFNLPFKETVNAKIKLALGSIEDELNWVERDKKSIRSTVVNTLHNFTENLFYLFNLESSI